MSVEYRIETYSHTLGDLRQFLERLQWFDCEKDGRFRFCRSASRAESMAGAEVIVDGDYVYIESNAHRDFGAMILGLVSTHLLTHNDHVVVSER